MIDPVTALAAFEEELARWDLRPVVGTEYNDNGYVRFRRWYAVRNRRAADGRPSEIPTDETIEPIQLDEEYAKAFPRIRAMAAVMDLVARSQKGKK